MTNLRGQPAIKAAPPQFFGYLRPGKIQPYLESQKIKIDDRRVFEFRASNAEL